MHCEKCELEKRVAALEMEVQERQVPILAEPVFFQRSDSYSKDLVIKDSQLREISGKIASKIDCDIFKNKATVIA